MAAPAFPAQQQAPACPYPPPSSADPALFDPRWAGLVFTVFTLDGVQIWTGEDGGRIRHRHPSTGGWSFQPVPFEVRGTIRKFHFRDNQQDGWAVSSDGWVLRTLDGGASWATLARMQGSHSFQEWEDLYSIWMDPSEPYGILLGRRGIWYTTSGGACWERADLFLNGASIDIGHYFNNNHVLFWGLAVQAPPPSVPGQSGFLGLVVGQPGYILRSVDWGQTWDVVYRAHIELDGLVTGTCLEAAVGPTSVAPWFELWDVAISNHATEPLAIAVGGVGNDCGLILASTDDGNTWSMEVHECEADPNLTCTNNPLYEPGTSPAYRHTEYRTLYGMSIYDDTNEAVAVGYHAQHLRREMTTSTPSVPVWRDRSSFGSISDAPGDTVIYPLWDATVVQGTDLALLSGAGGHVRASANRGEDWAHVFLGEPFRTFATFFKEEPAAEDRGWIVGQGYRVAWSVDGGKSWFERAPAPSWTGPKCFLFDITFAGNLENGVAVGCAAGTSGSGPKILYTDDFATHTWDEPILTNITYTINETHYLQSGHLNRVAWGGSSNLEFWAAGKAGLVLRTTDGGEKWGQVHVGLVSPSDDPLKFHIRSVAATGGTYVVLVGEYEGTAMAWIHNSSTGSWQPISPHSSQGISALTDVAIHGTSIYAVGQRTLIGGDIEGVVLKYNALASPPALEPIAGPFDPDGIPPCDSAGDVAWIEGLRTLTRLAFDPEGNLWIAGVCGRMWELPAASSTWVEHKSRTGTDVTCIQPLTGDRIYVAGQASNQIQQALVRLDR